MYSEFIRHINMLTRRTARFRRVALHLHSPDSYDWQPDPSTSPPDRFDGPDGTSRFSAELRSRLDVAAITDHMKCGFATEASSSTSNNDDFFILPGMEVSLVPEAALGVVRIHLLVIMPEGTSSAAFERIFTGERQIPNDKERTGQEEIRNVPLRDFVERVRREGGICIAAHVDSSRGIRRLFRQTAAETLELFADSDSENVEENKIVPAALRSYLLESGLAGIGIGKASDAPHYRWESEIDGRARWLPTMLTFDAHSIADLDRPSRITHLKMTNPGFQGLCEALAFPDTRIRFPDSLPEVPSTRLLGMRVQGTNESFFENVTIAFAGNLTCIIGPRGSGKSTLVEAMRYAFGRNSDLSAFKEMESSIREMQRTNLVGAVIRIAYQTKTNEVRVLEATFDPNDDISTKVFTAEGEFIDVPDLARSGELPLRLFGWSEIETLGRSPAMQRELLDRLVPNLAKVLRDREEHRKKLSRSRSEILAEIKGLQSIYERDESLIRKYRQRLSDFNKLNTAEVQALFNELDGAHARREVLTMLSANAESFIGDTDSKGAVSLESGLDRLLERGDQALRDWWLTQERVRLRVSEVEADVTALIAQARDRVSSLRTVVQQHLQETQGEVEGIHDRLREEVIEDADMQRLADLRANASKRLRAAQEIRDEYLQAWERLKGKSEARQRIVEELSSVQDQIAGIRSQHHRQVEAILNQFFTDAMKISIDFRAGGARDQFSREIEPLLSAAHQYKHRGLSAVIASRLTPPEFARLVAEKRLVEVVGLASPQHQAETPIFREDDAQRIQDALYPFGHDDSADVPVLLERGRNLENLLKAQEIPWDDEVRILLNDEPVNEKSPGQRSSAMLPLIALAEHTPLVIDQPEDNLDKRLIGRVLVRVLSDLKEKRQIIVCTHDPNILVGGDAEQVVVLDAQTSRKGRVIDHGSIDRREIVTTVVDLLEGGAEAFEARGKRYGLSVDGASRVDASASHRPSR